VEPKATFVDKYDSRGRGSVNTSFYRVSVRVLVLKYRRTRLKVRFNYSRNILIVEKTHDKKKEDVKPKRSGEKMPL